LVYQLFLINHLTNEFDRGEGLQQIHYRYALVENPDIPKHYQKKMKKHFGKDLEDFFRLSDLLEKAGKPRMIYRNCIKEGTYLSYYLKQMVDRDILVKDK
jgi:hypothetical protein